MKDNHIDEQNQTKNDILVSVIAPCYNVGKYLRSCLDSIINQTYTNLEIILVNDCSTDNTSDILAEYEKKDKRIKVVNNEKNSGASPSREKGFHISNGDWICFVDSDDALNPRTIETWIDEIDEETDILAGKVKNVKEEDFEKYVWNDDNKAGTLVLEHKEIMEHLGRFSQMEVSDSTWGKLFRRSLFEKSNAFQYRERFPLAYFEDTVLTPSLLIVGRKMKIVNQYLYLYRVVSNSMSHANGINKIEITKQRLIVFDTVLQWYDYNEALLFAIECELLQAIKLWYLMRKYYGRKSPELQDVEKIFDKWYAQYKTMKWKKALTSNIVISLFHISKNLCYVIVCRLWFDSKNSLLLSGIKKY